MLFPQYLQCSLIFECFKCHLHDEVFLFLTIQQLYIYVSGYWASLIFLHSPYNILIYYVKLYLLIVPFLH